MVNQASLTGESIPVAKRPGAAVYAGTVVEEGECVLRVTQQSGGSRYDKIVSHDRAVRAAQVRGGEHRPPIWPTSLVPYTLAGQRAWCIC